MMSEESGKNKERAQQNPNKQTEEEIRSYWSSDQQKEANFLPLPTIDAPRKAKKEAQDRSPNAKEVSAEPIGPDE